MFEVNKWKKTVSLKTLSGIKYWNLLKLKIHKLWIQQRSGYNTNILSISSVVRSVTTSTLMPFTEYELFYMTELKLSL